MKKFLVSIEGECKIAHAIGFFSSQVLYDLSLEKEVIDKILNDMESLRKKFISVDFTFGLHDSVNVCRFCMSNCNTDQLVIWPEAENLQFNNVDIEDVIVSRRLMRRIVKTALERCIVISEKNQEE